jgi:hypothetical protein
MKRVGTLLALVSLGCSGASTTGLPVGEGGGSGGQSGRHGDPNVDLPIIDAGNEMLDAGARAVAKAPAPDPGASVLERNGSASRVGHFVVPSLTKAAATKMLLERTFPAPFPGDVWASPLYLEQGPGGRGLIFAVTTSNDVHALDEKTGAIVWTTRIGNAPAMAGVPCGDVHPIGILSTPVIDLASRTLYLAGAMGQSTIERQEVHALSVDDGKERDGWPVDVSKIAMNTFDPSAQSQRGALSLVDGILYVPYGGHTGNCGAYRGWVIAIDTAHPATAKAWSTSGAGEGIDAPGGMASDGDGVFAVTGQSASPSTGHLDSQEVVRVSALAAATPDDRDRFYPGSWNAMDGAGSDFGSSNPILVEVPGAVPSKLLVATSGDGHLYLLDPQRLGGKAGQLVDFKVADGSTSIRTAPTSYASAKGTYIALTASSGVACPVGSPAPPVGNTGQVEVSIRIVAGSPPKPEIAWCYYLIQGQGAPVSTTTDGKTDALVWFMNDVKLLGLDGDTGREVYDGTHDISGIPFAERTCPGTHPWTSPIAVKGRMVVAASGRLCSWAPQ